MLLVLRREACIQAVTLFVEHVPDLTPYLAYLYPVLMARGVPMGSLYDPGLEIFVHDSDEHDAYKRYVLTSGICSYFYIFRSLWCGRQFYMLSILCYGASLERLLFPNKAGLRAQIIPLAT